MKYGELVKLTAKMGWFDLELLVQAFDDQRAAIRLQLSRWMKQGKVLALRRGMYALSDVYRKESLDPAVLAQHLCKPSYLSGVWALGFHGMIPERVVLHTSVTTRMPTRHENAFGAFEYRHIKRELFFGYEQVAYGGGSIMVARPEKALLDHWHLASGEWTPERIEEMRYQNMEKVNERRLREYAARFHRPRLEKTVDRWLRWAGQSEEGTVTL